ncbi:MAG TPA: sulfatase-like hydrolase/transferase [Terriglobia bacterium]|nr:sulfatase-like hydrolase/transferase [Terriglobia bacterium]
MKIRLRRLGVMTLLAAAYVFLDLGLCSAAAKARYNIVLLTPDQLGAKYMHTYNYPYHDTPNIDRLASEGTVFVHAYSAGSWTTPSFGSILTGLFPTVHGMTLPPYESCGPYITRPLTSGKLPPVPVDLTLSKYKPILPELLKPAGMITAADNANCWSIWDVASRGWDAFKFFPGYQLPVAGHPGASSFYLTAPQTTEWAENWLKAHKSSRFFLWVHYMEPHTPYNAPPQYDRFKTPDDYPDLTISNRANTPGLYPMAETGDVHAIRRLEQLYAAKILYMDHYVGQFLETVRRLDLKQNTIVILLSDHGQLLYSHPKDFNIDDHRSLYDADQHVPLIFWGAGIAAGQRVEALAGQYDLLPTILSLEGLPLPKLTDGKSLIPVLTGKTEQVNDYVYGEETAQTPQYSIRNMRFKLIETMRTGAIECFDLKVDPDEQRSICDLVPRTATQLKAALDKHITQMVREAHSYPDWQHNQALAVLEQRDTPQLEQLAPRHIEIGDVGAQFQLTGRSLWRLSPQGIFWAPPGDGSAWARWRFDTPMIGDYEIAVRWKQVAEAGPQLATHAEFLVRFKGGTRSFVVNLSDPPEGNSWLTLGKFHDPISVKLTNRADGSIIAGRVRFQRLTDR